jgi:hypothetical protein
MSVSIEKITRVGGKAGASGAVVLARFDCTLEAVVLKGCYIARQADGTLTVRAPAMGRHGGEVKIIEPVRSEWEAAALKAYARIANSPVYEPPRRKTRSFDWFDPDFPLPMVVYSE